MARSALPSLPRERERSRSSERDPLETALIVVGILAVLSLGWLGWRQAHSWICGSSNFISNDVCDEWNIAPPPEDALPVPDGWEVRWERLDCGSAGCGSRMYVLTPVTATEGGVDRYLDALRTLGWSVDGEDGAQRDDLSVWALPVTDRPFPRRLIPSSLVTEGNVFVSLALCGEGAEC
jgi:hypothetical protein